MARAMVEIAHARFDNSVGLGARLVRSRAGSALELAGTAAMAAVGVLDDRDHATRSNTNGPASQTVCSLVQMSAGRALSQGGRALGLENYLGRVELARWRARARSNLTEARRQESSGNCRGKARQVSEQQNIYHALKYG